MYLFFFFKQKTAYEMRISDWSSDVCSSDLQVLESFAFREEIEQIQQMRDAGIVSEDLARNLRIETENVHASRRPMATVDMRATTPELLCGFPVFKDLDDAELKRVAKRLRSEEHTSELQSLMRISYAVFCLKKKKKQKTIHK